MFRYDNIPEVPLQSVVLPPIREEELFLVRSMLQLGATELGASEAYNYSFVPDALLESVGAMITPMCRCKIRSHPRSRGSVAMSCQAYWATSERICERAMRSC